jgi:hypothetical protein
VTSGLLLAGTIYVIGQVVKLSLTERGDLYFVELPKSADGKYQKVLAIDNYSSAVVDDLEITIRAANISVHDPINVSSLDQRPIGPGMVLVKLDGVLPNRQSTVSFTSEAPIEQSSARLARAPSGFEFRAKDRLEQSFFDVGQLVNAAITFLIYVAGLTFADRMFASLRSELERVQAKLDKQGKSVDDQKQELNDVRIAQVKIKLLYVRKILALSKENEFWRKLMQDALKAAVDYQINAKKLVAIFLSKSGVKLEKTLDDYDEGELVDLLEETKVELSSLADRRNRQS